MQVCRECRLRGSTTAGAAVQEGDTQKFEDQSASFFDSQLGRLAAAGSLRVRAVSPLSPRRARPDEVARDRQFDGEHFGARLTDLSHEAGG